MASIYSCPLEIRQDILCHLSIDAKTVVAVALASKALFADSLFCSTDFAKYHVKAQFAASHENELWNYLHKAGIMGSGWRTLPFVYKVAVYFRVLGAPDWSNVEDGMDMSINYMNCNRWKLSSEEGTRVMRAVLADPDFRIAAQENRMFRWSARLGYVDIVRDYLHHPQVDPTAMDHYCLASTPEEEHVDIVKLLIADPRISPTSQNHLALRWACDHDHLETLKLLLANPRVNWETNQNYMLTSLVKRGHLDLAKEVLAADRVDPSLGENCVLRTAADLGYVDIVEILLKDKRVDPSTVTSSALALAAASGRLATVRLLMEDGRSDPSSFTNHGLRIAAAHNFFEVVELLLTDKRVDPTALNNIALRASIKSGHVKVVEILLKDKRVDASFEFLLLAGEKGHLEIVKLFLADFRMETTAARNYALAMAAERGRLEVVKEILADQKSMALDFTDAISGAIEGSHLEVIQAFLNDAWRFDSKFVKRGLELMVTKKQFYNPKIARMILGDEKVNKKQIEVEELNRMTDEELFAAVQRYLDAPVVHELLNRFLESEGF
ncbi:UNVERIFIED_CONTAM: hypothetical protein HDU68_011934 [Siphonaria sp. JEL0065]|nr:hypothetical protein HDU68_011934 [Siphonaria sp. JEL0065]